MRRMSYVSFVSKARGASVSCTAVSGAGGAAGIAESLFASLSVEDDHCRAGGEGVVRPTRGAS